MKASTIPERVLHAEERGRGEHRKHSRVHRHAQELYLLVGSVDVPELCGGSESERELRKDFLGGKDFGFHFVCEIP